MHLVGFTVEICNLYSSLFCTNISLPIKTKLHSAETVSVATNVPKTIRDSFVMAVTLPNRMEQLGYQWAD